MRTVRALALLAAVAVVACAPRNDEVPAPGSGGGAAVQEDSRVVGQVSVVGSAPMNVRVVVRPDGGGPPVAVTGPLAEEVRRLGGARVEVRGRRSGAEIEASDYDVVSVDGRPVVQGVVERAPDGTLQLRRRDGATVRLQGGTDPLRPGQKVWIQGPTTISVQTYGVISGS